MRKTTLLTLLALLFGVSFSAHAQYGVKTTVLNEDGTVNGAKYEYYIIRANSNLYVSAEESSTTDAVGMKVNNGGIKVKFIFVKTDNGYALYATNIVKSGDSYINVPVTLTPDESAIATLNTNNSISNIAYKLTPSGTPATFSIGSMTANNGSISGSVFIQLKVIYDSNGLNHTTISQSHSNNYWSASPTGVFYNWSSSNGGNSGNFFAWKVETASVPQMVFSSTEENTLGTYSSPVAFSIPTGVKAYKVSSTTPTENTITLEEITGTVPAGKGIIIEQHGSSLVYDVTTGTADDITTNLEATTVASSTSTITSTSTDLKTVSTYNVASPASTTGPIWIENSTNIYGLSGGTFYHLTNSDDASASYITLPPYKAYLVTTAANSSALKLQFPDGNTTSINAINAESNSNAAVYDLSGRRVNKTAKGSLYIQNGKKFIAE